MNLVNWALFVSLGVLAYVGLSLMDQLSAEGATSALGAAANLYRPYALLALLVGNMLWAVALYWGLKETRLAIPVLTAIGVVASFAYAVAFLGGRLSLWSVAGAVLIVRGIYCLA